MGKKAFRITKGILARSILIGLFLVVFLGIVFTARGYRLNLSQQTISSTGILVASSYPTGAKILINGELRGATNSNITLKPGQYEVEISKEGYSSWKKDVSIKGELVLKVDALLYPLNPSLTPVTNLGIAQAWFFPKTYTTLMIATPPEGEDIVSIPSVTRPDIEERTGVYLLQNAKVPIRISNPLRLLAATSAFPTGLRDKTFSVLSSPNDDQFLLTLESEEGLSTSYLLSASETLQEPFDVTQSAQSIREAWEREEEKDLQKRLEALDEPLAKIASDSFDILDFSPDDDKILYRAVKAATIPLIIDPPLIATNQTPESRSLEEGNLYVYDIKEDKNFLISDEKEVVKMDTKDIEMDQMYLWYPDSQHVVQNQSPRITVVDYDGTHRHTVYSGPFQADFIGVTGDFKLLILANLNPDSNELPDLYSVGIR